MNIKILHKHGIELVFEDDYIIALSKPSPFLTIPDRYNSGELSLSSLLKEAYGDVFTVHRLDKETSGLIVFAKTAEAHRSLSMAFESRTVKKQYLALVQGIPHPLDGQIDLAIDEHPSKKGTMMISKKGKESITDYITVEQYKTFSALHIFPRTGRTHQIRVHLKAIGHPLIVDPVYGTRSSFKLSEIKRGYRIGKDDESEKPFITRTTLHAMSAEFPHPATGELMKLESPTPKDLSALINQLRKLTAGKRG